MQKLAVSGIDIPASSIALIGMTGREPSHWSSADGDKVPVTEGVAEGVSDGVIVTDGVVVCEGVSLAETGMDSVTVCVGENEGV